MIFAILAEVKKENHLIQLLFEGAFGPRTFRENWLFLTRVRLIPSLSGYTCFEILIKILRSNIFNSFTPLQS